MHARVYLAASQRATEFPATAAFTEAVINHSQTFQANGHAMFIDGVVSAGAIPLFTSFVESDNGVYAPVIQKTIERQSVMSAVAAKGRDVELGVQCAELSQRNDTGNTVMSAGLNHTQKDGQITFEIGVIDGKNILRMAVEIAAVVAVPAKPRIRIGKVARTVTFIDTLFFTGTLFTARGRASRKDTGAIAGNTKLLRIAEQAKPGSRFCPNFSQYLLHEAFRTVLEGTALSC